MNRPLRGFEAPGNNHEVLVSKEKLIQRFLNEVKGLRSGYASIVAGDGRSSRVEARLLTAFTCFARFDAQKWSDRAALVELDALFYRSLPNLDFLPPKENREAMGILNQLSLLWDGLYRALSSPNDASSEVRAVVEAKVAEVLSEAPAAVEEAPEPVEEIPALTPEEAYVLEVFLDALSGDDRLLIRDIDHLASSAEAISLKELLKLIISMIKGEIAAPTSVEPVLLECMDCYNLDRPYTPKPLDYYIGLLVEARDSADEFEAGL